MRREALVTRKFATDCGHTAAIAAIDLYQQVSRISLDNSFHGILVCWATPAQKKPPSAVRHIKRIGGRFGDRPNKNISYDRGFPQIGDAKLSDPAEFKGYDAAGSRHEREAKRVIL
ncbi:MAG TPA: hypothetical protein VKS60_14485 [Stellaceae bacterium]|nr:hypothetical protein [Stellaceae bacterium]